MTFQYYISTILIATFFCSCHSPSIHNVKKEKDTVIRKVNIDSLQNGLNKNILFISDSLLKKPASFVQYLIQKNQRDSCDILFYDNTSLKEGFDGLKNIGDINMNGIKDTVFVLPPFNYCDDGQSYYFADTTLPRLFTESYCCHPDNVFSIGDIDEDGVAEICVFYSSCVSRFKSLIAYSIKDNEWKIIGRVTFDIQFMNPEKEKRVKKIAKGKFEMLEIVDDYKNKKWQQFSF